MEQLGCWVCLSSWVSGEAQVSWHLCDHHQPSSPLWTGVSCWLPAFSCSLNPVLQQVKENFARIQACISELRSLPAEGCFPQGGNGVVQAVQDGLQQFKQFSRHTAPGGSTNTSVEVRKCWEGSGSHPKSSCLVNVYLVCCENAEKFRYSALAVSEFQCPGVLNEDTKSLNPWISYWLKTLWKRERF